MTVNNSQEKILLAMLPFWDPQIPPIGIACIKQTIQDYGFETITVDANVEQQFRQIYDRYFNKLKAFIPAGNRGNLYKIGHEVFRNHLMAHMNYRDENEYRDLVKILIYHTFYHDIPGAQVSELQAIIHDFYQRLATYLIALLEHLKPTVLGLSVFNGTLPASIFAFKLTRQRFPHIKTLMGGGIFADQLEPNSPDFEYFLERTKDYIDKMIIGEGEILTLRYLQGHLPGSKRVYTMDDVGKEYMDITRAKPPDFSGFDLQHYVNLGIYSSRSCPFQCSFCSEASLWGKYRKKKPGQIAAEFDWLRKTHGSQLFLMGDCLLNPIISPMSTELAKLEIPVYWDGYLRVDEHACDPAQVLAWRQAGFYRARIGCESGSPRVLELMGKKVNLQQMKAAVSTLARAGIKTTTMWVIGHPGETEADFQETLNVIAELKDDIYEADCTPFYYFLSGLPGAGGWQKEIPSLPLYPVSAREMLLVQTWILDCEPSRAERYRRLNRFIDHIENMGIPNPYSLQQVYEADERWKKLQKHAAPALLEFKKDTFIDECKYVQQMFFAQEKNLDEIDFGF